MKTVFAGIVFLASSVMPILSPRAAGAAGEAEAAAAVARPRATSAFTSLLEKDCVDDASLKQTDYFRAMCPGRDDLTVMYEGGDGRSWIGLVKRDEPAEAGASYSELIARGAEGLFGNVHGRTLEWRYSDRKLVALIAHTSATSADESTSIENLVVIRVDAEKLQAACLVGTVNMKARRNAKAQARAIADDLNRPCM